MNEPHTSEICTVCGRDYGRHYGMNCTKYPNSTQFQLKPLMKTLPKYIQFSTPELCLAALAYLEKNGWTREENALADRGFTDNLVFREGNCVIHIYNKEKKIVMMSDSKKRIENYPFITSIADIADLFVEPPIRIGDHIAEISPSGVQVGCTFVPWTTIELILSKRPV